MRRLGILVILWAVLAPPGRAQEQKVYLPFDGAEFFSHILFSKGLKEVASFEQAVQDPSDTLILLFGNAKAPRVNDFVTREMAAFLRAGGNLLVATDRPTSLPALNVSLIGYPLKSPSKYHGHDDCPFLPYENGGADLTDARAHPLFQLLSNGIATNCPCKALLHPGSPCQELLNFQPGRISTRRYMVGSGKDAPPDGRVLVIAGHGMFMNGMMLQQDNDNFAFSVNAVSWLRERGDGKKRAKALFVVDGRIISNFDMNLTPPPPQLPMPTVAMLNRLVRGLEDEDFLHRVFVSLLGDRFKYVVPLLLTVGTALLLLYGGKKFLEGRHVRDTAVPSLVGAAELAPGGDHGRQRLLPQKHVWGAAQRLVRQWFQSELGVAPERWSAGIAASFRAPGSFLSSGALLGHAEQALKIAAAAEPMSVDLVPLIRSLPALSTALAEGRLTLLLEGKELRKTPEPAT